MTDKSDRSIERPHEEAETTLSRCLVDGDVATKLRDRWRRREALGISFIIESVVLVALILAPLMTGIAQPQLSRLIPPTLMPIVGSWNDRNPPKGAAPHPGHHAYIFPIRDFQPPLHNHVEDSHQTADSDVDPGQILPDGYPSSGIRMDDLGWAHSPLEPPPVETHKANEKSILKISEGVEQAQLVSRIEPRYPPLAVQTKKEGTVLLHAIIDVDGRIAGLEVVSGPPMLVQAAFDAVRQWRYRPTYLNGQAVEVETSITVIFRLGP